MTRRRYLNYRWARHRIDTLHDAGDCDAAVHALSESAEDLLLSRGSRADAEALAARVSRCLRELVAAGAVSRAVAGDIWQALCASGPGGAFTPGRLEPDRV